MQINQIFYEWVPKYFRLAILFLMVFVALCANGVYPGITANTYNDLGVYSEPYTMATNAMYIGMGAGFLFIMRFALRLTAKLGVITGFTMLLLLNVICATTSNPFLTIITSLVLGFCKILALGPILLAWIVIWSKKMESARAYPFIYFVALAGLYFITWLTAYFAHLYAWRYAYIVIFILIMVCIVLAVITFENHTLKKKMPLYQLDIPGLMLLIGSLMLINYAAVYGKVEDWSGSYSIRAAFIAALISMVLFIKRELNLKRPILNLNLLKKPNIAFGLVLFLLLGALTPSTFQSAYSINVLNFELFRNTEINLFPIPGVLAGSVLTFFWYRKKYSGYLMFIIGFSAFALYHIMMYSRFVPDLDITDFLIPSFFKGFGLATLYISIGLYATANLPVPQSMKVIGLIFFVRSFLGPGIMAELYRYFLYAGTNRHLSGLASEVDANDPVLMQYAESGGYYKQMLQQANLTALKEITGNIIIYGLSVIIVLIVFVAYRRIRKGIYVIS